jgi:predicted kinase
MNPTRKLVIMRGLPGSGKTTLARQIARINNGVVFSTDDFFVDGGEYRFDPSRIKDAHAWNLDRTSRALESSVADTVIVDNTSTQRWESAPYVEFAQGLGWSVEYVEPSTPWARDVAECARRTVHGVPANAIQRMADRWEVFDTDRPTK